MSLELKPEKVIPYLTMISKALISLNQNKGSYRRDIWDHLHGRYGQNIDYKDFLIAI